MLVGALLGGIALGINARVKRCRKAQAAIPVSLTHYDDVSTDSIYDTGLNNLPKKRKGQNGTEVYVFEVLQYTARHGAPSAKTRDVLPNDQPRLEQPPSAPIKWERLYKPVNGQITQDETTDVYENGQLKYRARHSVLEEEKFFARRFH